MKKQFYVISEDITRWEAKLEYLEFRGFMHKLMAKLLPGMFKKQKQKWLNQFK